MKLLKEKYQVQVDVSCAEAWNALAMYGDVGTFNAALMSSYSLNPDMEFGIGSERFCQIDRKVSVKERIIRYEDGEKYSYDVYEWENFPLKKMINTFGVSTDDKGNTVIYQESEFRLKPGFLSYVMKRVLRKGMRDALLSYKNFMETGDRRTDVKQLRQMYATF